MAYLYCSFIGYDSDYYIMKHEKPPIRVNQVTCVINQL